jgi:hypothetical protein
MGNIVTVATLKTKRSTSYTAKIKINVCAFIFAWDNHSASDINRKFTMLYFYYFLWRK